MEKFNSNRATPIKSEEFQIALHVLNSTSPEQMQRFMTTDKEIWKWADKLIPKLKNAAKYAEDYHKQHVFEPSDIHPDTCSRCGKVERYRFHIGGEGLSQRGFERAIGMSGYAGSAAEKEAAKWNALCRWDVFERMDEATQAARPIDYIFAFESIATGTLLYAVTNDRLQALAHKKAIQMRGPQAPPSAS